MCILGPNRSQHDHGQLQLDGKRRPEPVSSFSFPLNIELCCIPWPCVSAFVQAAKMKVNQRTDERGCLIWEARAGEPRGFELSTSGRRRQEKWRVVATGRSQKPLFTQDREIREWQGKSIPNFRKQREQERAPTPKPDADEKAACHEFHRVVLLRWVRRSKRPGVRLLIRACPILG